MPFDPIETTDDNRNSHRISTPEEIMEMPYRWADPLCAEILETWRLRQDMVRARTRLTLQIHAICRRSAGGCKKEGGKRYALLGKESEAPEIVMLDGATYGLRVAREPLEAQQRALERHLAKLGQGLPIAHMADQIRGVGHGTLATIVGEVGDMSTYVKGVSGIWKRAGLAVIDGQRQRKVSNLEAALIQGYSPERHSTFWNIGEALLKSQGKDEGAGPYRKVYDERKAYELTRTVTQKNHETGEVGEVPVSLSLAHRRACRFMVKRLLKDLWVEWRRVSK